MSARHSPCSSGFSMVEMAVVLVIMTLLTTAGLSALMGNREALATSQTKARQERIRQALVGFLRTNGRLPCPNAVAPWDGAEDTPCTGATAARGALPWAALGLGRDEVVDGWGNFFSYRVANDTPASSSNWTLRTPPTAFTLSELTAPLTTFTYRRRDDGGVLSVAQVPNPVVMVISHGKTGRGARTTQGTLTTAPIAANTDEVANATLNSTAFVERATTEVTGATGGTFDDLVMALTPRDLLQPLVDDKTLTGSTPAHYRNLALQQVALISCTPPSVAPNLAAVEPVIGNGALTYTCPAAAAYSCRSATPVSTASTLGTKQLYQLSIFGAAAQDVTFAQLLAAFPAIATRCP